MKCPTCGTVNAITSANTKSITDLLNNEQTDQSGRLPEIKLTQTGEPAKEMEKISIMHDHSAREALIQSQIYEWFLADQIAASRGIPTDL